MCRSLTTSGIACDGATHGIRVHTRPHRRIRQEHVYPARLGDVFNDTDQRIRVVGGHPQSMVDTRTSSKHYALLTSWNPHPCDDCYLSSTTCPNRDIENLQRWASQVWSLREETKCLTVSRRRFVICGSMSLGRYERLRSLPTSTSFRFSFPLVFSDAKTSANSESASTLLLYWDKVPDTFYRETEGTAEYDRRKAVRHNP